MAVGRKNTGPAPQIPPPFVGCLGGEEETLQRVRQTGLGGGANDVLLVNDRQDGARDDVPVLAESNRDDWLDVDLVLKAVAVGASAPVEVILDRSAGQSRDGVGELLGELGSLSLLVLRACAVATGGRSVGGREGEEAVEATGVLSAGGQHNAGEAQHEQEQ